MLSIVKRLAVLLLIFGIASCAGKNFVRPTDEQLKNGQTTYSQIIQQLGQPRQEGTVLKNEITLKSIVYSYAYVGGEPRKEGVIPARAMAFFFYNDTMVGYNFVSSWAEDHTDFDETKINAIVKNKTTRAEFQKMLKSHTARYPIIN